MFSDVGGFDESFACASVEDIELGGRLRRAGHRVWLCPDVQVTYIKRWTLASLLRTDVFDRAIPWTRLILRNRHLPIDLNLDVTSRLSAVAAWATVVFLVLGFWWPWMGVGAALALATVGTLNAGPYRFFVRQGGLGFAAGAVALHLLYLLYSSLVFALIAAPTWLTRTMHSLRRTSPA